LGAKAITAPAYKTEDLARFEEMYCAPTGHPAWMGGHVWSVMVTYRKAK